MHQLVGQPATIRARRKSGERLKRSRYLVAFLIAATFAISRTGLAQTPAANAWMGTAKAKAPDAGFYTNYSVSSDQTTVAWTVCGQTKKASGCDASGSLGPFGKVATLMEGLPYEDVPKKIVVRNITVTFGPTDEGAHFILAPDGTPVQDGGGELFMLNPIEGIIPSTFE
jgi:hypothetical protein